MFPLSKAAYFIILCARIVSTAGCPVGVFGTPSSGPGRCLKRSKCGTGSTVRAKKRLFHDRCPNRRGRRAP